MSKPVAFYLNALQNGALQSYDPCDESLKSYCLNEVQFIACYVDSATGHAVIFARGAFSEPVFQARAGETFTDRTSCDGIFRPAG